MRPDVALVLALAVASCVQHGPRASPLQARRAAELIDDGISSLRSGDLDLAEAAFEAAHEISRSGQAIDGLGCVAFRRGALDDAERYFSSALREDPAYAVPILHLAMVEEVRGNLAESSRLFEAAIKREPASYRARNNLAVFLSERGEAGDLARAREELRKAYVLEPSEVIAANREKIEKEHD